jgi:hypothetical protein
MLSSRHGTVVAYLALFVALGGTSVAAVKLSKNSVKSIHIKNGQVKRVDLAPGLRGPGLPGPQGPQGERGAQGERGLPGGNGSDGASGPHAVLIHGRPAADGSNVPYTVAITDEWTLKVTCNRDAFTPDGDIELSSNSTASNPLVKGSWINWAGSIERQSASASGDQPVIAKGFNTNNYRWDGQIIHSSAAGVASVVFHLFVKDDGTCGIDGVGTVAG